jgi:hypothetical protein
MSAMLDVIAALAIGTMFMLTMMNTMFNIQTYGQNIEAMMVLTEISKNSVEVLEEDILANVGANETRRIAGSVFAQDINDTLFGFWGLLDVNNDGVLDDVYIQMRFNSTNNRLIVRYSTVYPNPNWVLYYRDQLAANGLNIEYITDYDPDTQTEILTNSLAVGDANANPPIGVQISLTFEAEGRGETDFGDFATLQNRVVFWRYFKSLHM